MLATTVSLLDTSGWKQPIQTSPMATWTAIAMSGNGQYQTGLAYNGYAYSSIDSGNTWNIVIQNKEAWKEIAMSYTGQYQTAVVFKGPLYTSCDYGQTWKTSSIGSKAWSSLSISYTGQVQYATVNQAGGFTTQDNIGAIYKSTNYGITWEECVMNTKTVNGEWIQIDYNQGYAITGYTVTDPVYQLPESAIPPYWTLVGSNDKKNWYVLDTVSDSRDLSNGGVLTWQKATPPMLPRPLPQSILNAGITITIPYRQTTRTLTNTLPFSSYRFIMGSQFGVTGVGGLSFQGIGTFRSTPTQYYNGSNKDMDFSGYIYDLSGNGTTISGTDYSIITNSTLSASMSWSWRNATVDMTQYVAYGDSYAEIPPVGILCIPPVSYLCVQNQKPTSITQTLISSPYSFSMKWTSISMSSNAQMIVASYMDSMPTSVPYGMSYDISKNTITTPIVKTGNSGKYEPYGGLLISTDYGQNWMPHMSFSPYSQPWHSVSVSADGSTQWASGENGVYVSKNGVTSLVITTPSTITSKGLVVTTTVTGDGTTAFILFRNTLTKQSAIYVSNSLTVIPVSGIWTGLATSYDASIVSLCASQQYIQTFLRAPPSVPSIGQWTQDTNSSGSWISIVGAMPPIIYYVAANSTGIYQSTDGTSWTSLYSLSNVVQVCVSHDGTRIVALTPSAVYLNDATHSWVKIISATSSQYFTCIALSTLSSIIDMSYIENNSGGIMQYNCITSTTILYKPSPPSVLNSNQWTNIAVSDDGTVRLATLKSGVLYRSVSFDPSGCSLSGCINWTLTGSPTLPWADLDMSVDGRYQSAAATNEGIYYSDNFGGVWLKSDAPNQLWKAISLSYTGQYQVAVAFNGSLYISSNYGKNWVVGPGQTIEQSWNTVFYSYDAAVMKASYKGSIQTYVWTTKSTAINCSYSPWINVSVGLDITQIMEQERTLLYPALFGGTCSDTLTFRGGVQSNPITINPQVCSSYSGTSNTCPTTCVYEYELLRNLQSEPVCNNGFIQKEIIILAPGKQCPNPGVSDSNNVCPIVVTATQIGVGTATFTFPLVATKYFVNYSLSITGLSGQSFGYKSSNGMGIFTVNNLIANQTYNYMIQVDISSYSGYNPGQITMVPLPPTTLYNMTTKQDSNTTGKVSFSLESQDDSNIYQLTLTNQTQPYVLTCRGFSRNSLNKSAPVSIPLVVSSSISSIQSSLAKSPPTITGILLDDKTVQLTYTLGNISQFGTYQCVMTTTNADGKSTTYGTLYMNQSTLLTFNNISDGLNEITVNTTGNDPNSTYTLKCCSDSVCTDCNGLSYSFTNVDNIGTYRVSGMEYNIEYKITLFAGIVSNIFTFTPTTLKATFNNPTFVSTGIGTADIQFGLVNTPKKVNYSLRIPLQIDNSIYTAIDASGQVYNNKFTQNGYQLCYMDTSLTYISITDGSGNTTQTTQSAPIQKCISGNGVCFQTDIYGNTKDLSDNYLLKRHTFKDISEFEPCLAPYVIPNIHNLSQIIPRVSTYQRFPMEEWLIYGMLLTLENNTSNSLPITWTMYGSDGVNIDIGYLSLPTLIKPGKSDSFLVNPLQGFFGYADPVSFMSNFWTTFTINMNYGTRYITTTIQLSSQTPYTTYTNDISNSVVVYYGYPIQTLSVSELSIYNNQGVYKIGNLIDGQSYPYEIIATLEDGTVLSSGTEILKIDMIIPTLPSMTVTQTDIGTVTVSFPTSQNEPFTQYSLRLQITDALPYQYQWINANGISNWCLNTGVVMGCTTNQNEISNWTGNYYSDTSSNITTFTDSTGKIVNYTVDANNKYYISNGGGLVTFPDSITNSQPITVTNARGDTLIMTTTPRRIHDICGNIITSSFMNYTDLSDANPTYTYTSSSCSIYTDSSCQVIGMDLSGQLPIKVSPLKIVDGVGTYVITQLQPRSYTIDVTAKTQYVSAYIYRSVNVVRMPPTLNWPSTIPNIKQTTDGHVTITVQINDNPGQTLFTPPSTFYDLKLFPSNDPTRQYGCHRIISDTDSIPFIIEGNPYYTVTVENSFVIFNIYQLVYPPNNSDANDFINTSYNYDIYAVNRDGSNNISKNQFVLTFPYTGKVNCIMSTWAPFCDSTLDTCASYALGTLQPKPQTRTIKQDGLNGGDICPTNVSQPNTCLTNLCPLSELKFDSSNNTILIKYTPTSVYMPGSFTVTGIETKTVTGGTVALKNIQLVKPDDKTNPYTIPNLNYSYGSITYSYSFTVTATNTSGTVYTYSSPSVIKLTIPPLVINSVTLQKNTSLGQNIVLSLSNIPTLISRANPYYSYLIRFTSTRDNKIYNYMFPLSSVYNSIDTIIFQPQLLKYVSSSNVLLDTLTDDMRRWSHPLLIQNSVTRPRQNGITLDSIWYNIKLLYDTYNVTVSIVIDDEYTTNATSTVATSSTFPNVTYNNVNCEAGYYCPTFGYQTQCPVGSYCPAGSIASTQCPAGTYSFLGWAGCAQCPAGSYCTPGPTTLSLPQTCSHGAYCPAGSSENTPCPANSYCPNTSTKFNCPYGGFTDKAFRNGVANTHISACIIPFNPPAPNNNPATCESTCRTTKMDNGPMDTNTCYGTSNANTTCTSIFGDQNDALRSTYDGAMFDNEYGSKNGIITPISKNVTCYCGQNPDIKRDTIRGFEVANVFVGNKDTWYTLSANTIYFIVMAGGGGGLLKNPGPDANSAGKGTAFSFYYKPIIDIRINCQLWGSGVGSRQYNNGGCSAKIYFGQAYRVGAVRDAISLFAAGGGGQTDEKSKLQRDYGFNNANADGMVINYNASNNGSNPGDYGTQFTSYGAGGGGGGARGGGVGLGGTSGFFCDGNYYYGNINTYNVLEKANECLMKYQFGYLYGYNVQLASNSGVGYVKIYI